MDKYIIKKDKYNWILCKIGIVGEINKITGEPNKNAGSEKVTELGYFDTIEKLKGFAVEHALKVNDISNIEKIKNQLLGLING